jgi:2,4-diaminopentanoate dehydrogenase
VSYRVVQWATGSVGTWSLKEIIRHPDLELVGLRCYGPDKVGVDAGVIAGGEPIGVIATDSLEEILAIDCDVVVHCAQAFGAMEQMKRDVIALLETGKNVVTVSDYISPDLWRGGLLAELDQAAKRGGATLHGTGIDPGFLCDRLPATLTGLSTEVDHVRMLEIADLRGHPNPAMIMDLLGFGLEPARFSLDPSNPGLIYCALMFPQALHALFGLLGTPLDRIETAEPVLAVARRDLNVAAGEIKAGTIAGITWMFKGFRPEDPADDPFATHQWSWYLEPDLPGMPEAHGHYQIRLDIEGTPTLRTVIDITHPEDPFFMPTAGAAIRAIPEVVAAPPGHLMAPVFGAWSPRLDTPVGQEAVTS